MKIRIKEYLKIATTLTLIDIIYLSSISSLFKQQVQKVQKSPLEMKLISTIMCYSLLTLGTYYGIVIKKLSVKEMFGLGIFVYGIYELTNHAILKNWEWKTVILDTLWGGILFASITYLYKYKLKSF